MFCVFHTKDCKSKKWRTRYSLWWLSSTNWYYKLSNKFSKMTSILNIFRIKIWFSLKLCFKLRHVTILIWYLWYSDDWHLSYFEYLKNQNLIFGKIVFETKACTILIWYLWYSDDSLDNFHNKNLIWVCK